MQSQVAGVPLSEIASVSPTAAAVPADPGLQGAHPADFYVQAALQRNPEILARESRVSAEAERIPQVASLPDPMLTNNFWPIPGNSPQTASGRMPNGLMVSQQFPWFGKLRLRGQVADLEAKIALTDLAAAQLKVMEDVKLSYYNIYFYQQAFAITQQNEDLIKKYAEVAQSLYKVGKTSQQDVLRAQVEVSKLRDQLIELNRQLRESQADLAKSLGTSPESDLRATDASLPPVPQQIDRLYQLAVTARPELQGKLQAILRDQTKIDLARLDYLPDVNVGVAWDAMAINGALARTADGTDNVGFSIGVNIPIRFGKLRAGVREAQDRAAESTQMFQATRDDTLRLIKRYTVQARALEEQIKLYRDDIIFRAKQTLDASASDYQVGKVTFLQLIDNWQQLLRFQIQLVRLQTLLGQTLASLERVVGAQLTEQSAAPPAVPPK